MKNILTHSASLGMLCLALSLAPAALADLTPEQKLADFRELAALYDKQYAPYEWKRTLFGFDALNIGPWLDRVSKTTTDLDFFELCVEYVSSLNDTHDSYQLDSDFSATLGFGADLYDGKALIETINRALLPAAKYPFTFGDELVSVDGKTVEQLLTDFAKYGRQGNPRSTRRMAAIRITSRPQVRMPHAADLGDSASVVIKGQDGTQQTYTIPWIKSGTPLAVGPVPNPQSAELEYQRHRRPSRVSSRSSSADAVGFPLMDDPIPDYLQLWIDIQHAEVQDEGLLNYGSRTPIFALPDGFTMRLGTRSTDFFLSGTYQAGGRTIGFIRIPNYGSLAASVQAQFDTEIAFFQANTDGLVIDQMRNTGGFLCFGENIATRLIPYPFRPIGYQYRATWQRVNAFFSSLDTARRTGADQWIIDTYQAFFNEVYQAYQENRGLTGPLFICGPSGTRYPGPVVYTKPLIMLIDEFSTSTADSVPAMLQDAHRGLLFGMRTNGAGGTNTSFFTGSYTLGLTGMTLGLQTRANPITTPDFPTSILIENIGVRPDVVYDYMTKDNLLQRGRPFVDAFTAAILGLISKGN
jgi:hypothetical protein